jgi:predicted lipoprotein with Yx(FWY)xxD motif
MSTVIDGVRNMTGQRMLAAPWLLLRVAGAGLLFATAAIHLDLYLTGYQTIPTIGPLFLFQVIAVFLVGALVLVMRSRLVAAAGALLALSTLGGYLLTVQFGLFGFREVRTTAGIVAGIIEVAAFVVLALYAAVASSPDRAAPDSAPSGRGPSGRGPSGGGPSGGGPSGGAGSGGFRSGLAALPSLSWRQASLGAGAVAVVAFALLGGALAGAGSPAGASGPASASAELRTTTIGGLTVLTNAAGRTLYWFAPDTPTKSVCNGSCAVYWPPLRGPLTAGAGVTGQLSTIKRADGTTQETYEGHPLYTYIGDSGPGQDHGNNLNLNGGLWHVVTASSH